MTRTIVPLDISCTAGYPFFEHLYNTVIGSSYSNIRGKVKSVFYGFIYDRTHSKQHGAASLSILTQECSDRGWQNSFMEYGHEGEISVQYLHNGGYKGSMVGMNMLVTVPRSASIIFNWKYDSYRSSNWTLSTFDGTYSSPTFTQRIY